MSNVRLTDSIVSVQWLKDNLAAENLIIFDASMKPIGAAANAPQAPHPYIPGSLRFDFLRVQPEDA